ncbi:hypothetical protein TNCV_759841 [Trichonephila clavipes]|nr:hypothetical protein TNCV_759841 [Trichonephila clavipes]
MERSAGVTRRWMFGTSTKGVHFRIPLKWRNKKKSTGARSGFRIKLVNTNGINIIALRRQNSPIDTGYDVSDNLKIRLKTMSDPLDQEWRTNGTGHNILGTPRINTVCILIQNNKVQYEVLRTNASDRSQVSARFPQFRQLSETFMYPDVTLFNKLNLSQLDWLEIENNLNFTD